MALPVQPPDMLNGLSHKASLSSMHNALHEEIDQFCKQVPPFSSASGITNHFCVVWDFKLTLMPNDFYVMPHAYICVSKSSLF
jgi:hypothetical protein